jgi:hypothetical protein
VTPLLRGSPMRLIRLVVILALSLALAPLAVGAQQVGKVYRVGVLASSTESNFGPSVRIFREALYAPVGSKAETSRWTYDIPVTSTRGSRSWQMSWSS